MKMRMDREEKERKRKKRKIVTFMDTEERNFYEDFLYENSSSMKDLL